MNQYWLCGTHVLGVVEKWMSSNRSCFALRPMERFYRGFLIAFSNFPYPFDKATCAHLPAAAACRRVAAWADYLAMPCVPLLALSSCLTWRLASSLTAVLFSASEFAIAVVDFHFLFLRFWHQNKFFVLAWLCEILALLRDNRTFAILN